MRFFESLRHASRGIISVFRAGQNFMLQITVGLVLIFMGIFFRVSIIEWLSLILIATLVLILEMINTAVEKILDVVKPRLDERVGLIKDIMAGAVLISSFSSLIIGFFVFLPRIFAIFYFVLV